MYVYSVSKMMSEQPALGDGKNSHFKYKVYKARTLESMHSFLTKIITVVKIGETQDLRVRTN